MKEFVKRMINEHKDLIARVSALEAYIYSEQSDKDDKVEFANKCLQLKGMKIYLEALSARLENQGILFDGQRYYNVVTDEPPVAGRDFDEEVKVNTKKESINE